MIPGSPRFSVLQATESWAGPGNEATQSIDWLNSSMCEMVPVYSPDYVMFTGRKVPGCLPLYFVSFFSLFHQLFVNVGAVVYQVHLNVVVRHDNEHSHMAGVLDCLLRKWWMVYVYHVVKQQREISD